MTSAVANAPPPLLVWSARGSPSSVSCRGLRKKHRGRAGRQRVQGALKFTQCAQTKMLGPTGLDTSRHRGVTPSFAPRGASKGKPRGAFRASQGLRKSASPKASRARCLRFAPHGPRWTYLSGDPPLLANWKAAYPPLSGPGRAGKPVTGCRRRRHGAQWRAAGAPGHMRLGPPGPRIASPMQGHSPATAPRPASEDAVQTPLGTRRDGMEYDPRLWRDYGPSAYGPSRHFAMR